MTSLPQDSSLAQWLTVHGLVTVLAVLVYVVTSHVMHQRRHPSAAVAWILFILLLPYLALPVYLIFGSRKLPRPNPAGPAGSPAMGGTGIWAVDTIAALGQPLPAAYDALHVHRDGDEARAALFETIDGAQASIDVCTFILGRDALGETIVDMLRKKVEGGVRVRLLLDGMGSVMARPPKLAGFEAAGGEFVRFVPPLHSPLKGRTNLRNHRKLLVADAGQGTARLWCGGRNLAAPYFSGVSGRAPWRDLSFDLRGPLVAQAAAMFERDWAFARGEPTPPALPTADAPPNPPSRPADGAQLVASGPDQADDTVHALLVTAAYRARRRIALATPYFVPEPALLMALCLAARRGVAVELLLPARSNHRLSDLARARGLRALAEAGGHIWLAPQMMHAKLAVIDDVLALAGSVNLDSRSLFLNYELMVAFHGAADVERFGTWFDRERATATAYAARRPGLMRDALEGMILWVGFQL